jgi:serine/threonine protein phosphatase PrpC
MDRPSIQTEHTHTHTYTLTHKHTNTHNKTTPHRDRPEFGQLYFLQAEEGDVMLLASDGLFDNLYDQVGGCFGWLIRCVVVGGGLVGCFGWLNGVCVGGGIV